MSNACLLHLSLGHSSTAANIQRLTTSPRPNANRLNFFRSLLFISIHRIILLPFFPGTLFRRRDINAEDLLRVAFGIWNEVEKDTNKKNV